MTEAAAWDGEGVDPWLPERLAAAAEIVAAEQAIRGEVYTALQEWIVAVRRGVLGSLRPDPIAVYAHTPQWTAAGAKVTISSRTASEVEAGTQKDPIERVRTYLVNSGQADQEFLDAIEAESDKIAAELRKSCLEMPDPSPMSIFDHAYAEPHPLIDEEREAFGAYLDSFEHAKEA